MSDKTSAQLVAITNEINVMYRRVAEIREDIPGGHFDRALAKLLGDFPAVFMELRDQIGCAVLRESREAEG